MAVNRKQEIPDRARDVILGQMEWAEVEGKTVGRITVQLDRALYEEVNKVLERLGGKWDKRKQFRGHVFDEDPRPALVPAAGRGVLEYTDYDFFETPPNVVAWMVDLARFGELDLQGQVFMLEPSAGMGRILDAVRASFPTVNCHYCELDPKRLAALQKLPGRTACVGQDFLEYLMPEHDGELFRYDRILMNPPFSKNQWKKHVEHAWALLRPGGVLVSVVPGGSRMRDEWEEGFGAQARNAYDLPAGTFKEAGTGVTTHLLVLRKVRVVEKPHGSNRREPVKSESYQQGRLL